MALIPGIDATTEALQGCCLSLEIRMVKRLLRIEVSKPTPGSTCGGPTFGTRGILTNGKISVSPLQTLASHADSPTINWRQRPAHAGRLFGEG
jgi:hypothetical protein